MINFKKIAALGLAVVLGVSTLAGCGGGQAASNEPGPAPSTETGAAANEGEDAAPTVETVHHKIGVAHYTDAGAAVDGLHAYLDGLAGPMNLEFEWVTLSTYDEATNLTAIQNLISSGCEGILLSADMGTASIVAECASAGVYVAGYLCDFDASYNTDFDNTFGSEYFLGTVGDGEIDRTGYGEAVAAKVIESGYKNIGLIAFPSWAYSSHAVIANAFCAKIDEYNATASEPIKYTEVTELMFQPLEDNYFAEHPDLDCVFSIAAGQNFVYPVMVAAGVNEKVDLFTSGYEATSDLDNFGTNGDGCYQGVCCSPIEGITYALCLVVDKLNGTTYADMPEKSERADCNSYVILSQEQMDRMAKTIYSTANFADSAFTAEDVINMCASYNPEATYAGLKEAVAGVAAAVN